MSTILLTGATGFIASHVWLSLLAAGYEVVGVDDFSNSSPEVLNRITRVSGRQPCFKRSNVSDEPVMDELFRNHHFAAVIHFAGFKSVSEACAKPLQYYVNNVGGLLSICQTMQRHGCERIVFSSSATVYGRPQHLPIKEDAPLSTANPYGTSKLMGETILRDVAAAAPTWQSASLRYFNPVGAHESGLIGEDPRDTPNNLMPYVAQVAIGRRSHLQVFGNDYKTPDGTGVRDYIHVLDLAEGHVAALRFLLEGQESLTVNLGTGRGYSVLDVVEAYERASGQSVPYKIAPRRPGDVDSCFADASLAREKLGWAARHDLARMCEDSWRWQRMNPSGFAETN